FGNPGRVDCALTELANTHVRKGETLSDYCTRYQLLMRDAQVEDSDTNTGRRFRLTLPQALRWQVEGALLRKDIPEQRVSLISAYVLSFSGTNEALDFQPSPSLKNSTQRHGT